MATLTKPISYETTGWNLTELLPSTEEAVIRERLAALEDAVQAFVAKRTALTPEISPGAFLAILREYEQIIAQVYKLGAYGSLWFSANTQDQAALTYRNRIQQVYTDVQNRMLFFDLW